MTIKFNAKKVSIDNEDVSYAGERIGHVYSIVGRDVTMGGEDGEGFKCYVLDKDGEEDNFESATLAEFMTNDEIRSYEKVDSDDFDIWTDYNLIDFDPWDVEERAKKRLAQLVAQEWVRRENGEEVEENTGPKKLFNVKYRLEIVRFMEGSVLATDAEHAREIVRETKAADNAKQTSERLEENGRTIVWVNDPAKDDPDYYE